MGRGHDAADDPGRRGEPRALAVGNIGKREPFDDQGLRRLEKLVGWGGLGIEITLLRSNALRAEGGTGSKPNVG